MPLKLFSSLRFANFLLKLVGEVSNLAGLRYPIHPVNPDSEKNIPNPCNL